MNKELGDKVFIPNDKIIKCDIGIILGGVSMIPYRVEGGIKLYKEGKVSKLLVSGGIGFKAKNKDIEAYKMKEYLLSKGIPEEDIIVEDKSRDTKENMINSIKLIDSYNKIVIITSDFHLKRSLKLFKKYSSKEVYGYGVEDGVYDKNNWYKTKEGRKRIRLEMVLLKLLGK